MRLASKIFTYFSKFLWETFFGIAKLFQEYLIEYFKSFSEFQTLSNGNHVRRWYSKYGGYKSSSKIPM